MLMGKLDAAALSVKGVAGSTVPAICQFGIFEAEAFSTLAAAANPPLRESQLDFIQKRLAKIMAAQTDMIADDAHWQGVAP